MINTRTSWWRRRRHVAEIVTDEVPESAHRRDAADDVVLHDVLWTAISKLPPKQRAIVVLRYYEDLSEAETAEIMGVTVGTVKSTTARALARLRDSSGLRDDDDIGPRHRRPDNVRPLRRDGGRRMNTSLPDFPNDAASLLGVTS